MKYNQLYNDSLYTFFCRDNSLNIFSILKTFNGINVLYENGFFFSYAISKGNIEICQALLDYFETKQFPEKNQEYNEAKKKLIEILENAVDDEDILPEMQKLLSPYIDFDLGISSKSFDDTPYNPQDKEYDLKSTTNNTPEKEFTVLEDIKPILPLNIGNEVNIVGESHSTTNTDEL